MGKFHDKFAQYYYEDSDYDMLNQSIDSFEIIFEGFSLPKT